MIDLNIATADEIDRVLQLKGHGYEIVRYRQERGGFTELRQHVMGELGIPVDW